MREQRNVTHGASATVGEWGDSLSGRLLHVAAIFCSGVGSLCERLRVLAVRQVCIWTVRVLGPSPLSRCGGGECERC